MRTEAFVSNFEGAVFFVSFEKAQVTIESLALIGPINSTPFHFTYSIWCETLASSQISLF